MFGLCFSNFTNISVDLFDGTLPAWESCWQVACPATQTHDMFVEPDVLRRVFKRQKDERLICG